MSRDPRHAFKGRKVNVFNLLCDHHYVDAVQWHALSTNCSVFHLASPTLEDVGLLPAAGVLLNAALIDPSRLDAIERGKNYLISDFGAPPANMAQAEILFESRVGISKSTGE